MKTTNKIQQFIGQRIAGLRGELGYSQEELAKKLGITRQSLSLFENGQRKISFDHIVKLSQAFGVSVDEFLMVVGSKQKLTKQSLSKENFSLEEEKVKNLILYIASRCGGRPNFGETLLYKMLYFIDFDAYEQLGKPVTGLHYVKLQFGPVPVQESFLKITNDMKQNGELEVLVREYHARKQKRYIALQDPRLEVFTQKEKELIDHEIAKLGVLSAVEIENYSHGDVPWQITEMKSVIEYDLVFQRKLPYAYRDYNELSESASASDILNHLGEMSEDEANYYDSL